MEKFKGTLNSSRLNYLYALHINLGAAFKRKEKLFESKRTHARQKVTSHIRFFIKVLYPSLFFKIFECEFQCFLYFYILKALLFTFTLKLWPK